MGMVVAILEKHLSGIQVRVYGSRARGKAKPFSDLDLCLMNEQPLSFDQICTLMDAFSESDLPFTVDVTQWAVASGEMRRRIEREAVVLL